MPTPPPEEVKEPRNATERLARAGAITHIRKLCEHLDGYAYNTRSCMPAGLDFTEFGDALQKVRRFCEARPDWTLAILEQLEKDLG